MVERENSPNNYKTLKISIEKIRRNPEMLKLIPPDHLKTTEMCKNAVKKLSIITMCVPGPYRTQEM